MWGGRYDRKSGRKAEIMLGIIPNIRCVSFALIFTLRKSRGCRWPEERRLASLLKHEPGVRIAVD